MPYGVASEETKDILRSNDMMKALDIPEEEDEQNPTLSIDVIIDGALDESFEVLEQWAVNVVDLLADYLRENYSVGVEWEVVAYRPFVEGETHYERNNCLGQKED